jgi:DNA-binding GntR family transcriptional regulator
MDLPRFAEALSLLQRAVMRAAAQRRTAKDLARIQAAYEAFGDASLDRDPLDLTLLNRAFHVAIAEASHSHSADNLALTSASLLAIADAAHAHLADEIELTLTTRPDLPVRVVEAGTDE